MAWEDPQWGGKRGKNDGPPDLDELVRNIQRKIGDAFNRKGGGNQTGGGSPVPGGFGLGLSILAGLAFMLWLASGFYIVDAAKRGVVQRFGRYVETTHPGPHWRLPWPVEEVTVLNVDQIRTVTLGYRDNVKNKIPKESLMLTDDENIVDLQFAVQYNINNPVAFLFNVRDPDFVVAQVAESSIREIVGKSKMDYVLYEGREDVASHAQSLMQQLLDRYGAGVAVLKVTMQNAQPPEQVQASFDDAVKAGQDRERQKNEGQAYANDVVPKAQGMASRLLAEANGYQQRVVADAQGDVARFNQILPEYQKAPAVTRERMYLDTMQQVLENSSKVVVDTKGSGNMLYLPLDKLMEKARVPEVTATPVPEAVPKPAEAAKARPEALSRSRDAFRSREREARP
jgi:modulator of FtsH protease HflK